MRKGDDSNENSDEEVFSLEDYYKKLITYKNNLFKINTLINMAASGEETTKYQKMKNSLTQAIAYQDEAIKLAEDENTESFSKDRILPEYIDRVSSKITKKKLKLT